MTAPPLFVTFEGGEGSGKSTQIERAADVLRSLGRRVTVTREPGGTPMADALRAAILGGKTKDYGPSVEAALFAAARADHVLRRIKPALQDGSDVLCDRFHDSTRVYQGGEDAVDDDLLRLLEEAALQGLRPDLTLMLDVPASMGLARAAARRAGGEADRFEAENLQLHERRRQAFLAIARREPERCRVIDATKTVDVVAEQVEALLLEQLTRRAEAAPVVVPQDRSPA